MSAAMASAAVGDDVFGDDPTIAALEERVADMFDKEAALFVPTGTMGNLICVMAHTWERGSEYLVGDKAHIYIYEQGGGAAVGGAHPRAVPTSADGTLPLDILESYLRPDDPHFPVSKLLALESTHNLCGGSVLSTDYVRQASDFASRNGLALHMDGARIWHAASALGVSLAQIGEGVDSLSVCLSKALGAPAGSVVVGSSELVRRGRRLRKVLGGGMRQSGVLAAAGLVALEEQLPELAQDHRHALKLAEGLEQMGFDISMPETNLVYFSCPEDKLGISAPTLVQACQAQGVRFLGVGGSRLRMVTHHQVDSAGVDRTLDVVQEILQDPEAAAAQVASSAVGSPTNYGGGSK
uniref:Aromatic amino acid beta-eliminating lyase/threonine aldolase domain-containing protein n=1 Tax=Rhizochromulina marina TaxID=1034831 RepID=A0A7S2WGP9_9STRA